MLQNVPIILFCTALSYFQVLGWYHSHPHITVWPSHVDVGTQADYQLMDSNFIGVIFSCFHDTDKVSE